MERVFSMKDVVLLPRDRRGVINKEVCNTLKEKLNVDCVINDNAAELDGEGLELMTAKNIAKAIGRGFSPVRAYRLLDEDVQFEIFDMARFNDARIKAVKSRVIGTKGKTRNMIEECTGAFVSVYGKTISVIGNPEELKNASKAIEMLINGSEHKTVYRFLGQVRE
jgi:ribosomal RNA assembly protein